MSEKQTVSDCAIDAAGKASTHVCEKPECRDAHELAQHKPEEKKTS
jgi:hypothetical protein